MHYKKALSLITLVLFIFVLSFAYGLNLAKADGMESDIVVGESIVVEEMERHEDGKKEPEKRTANVHQYDTVTTPWGETYQKWSYSPDIGYGETGEGLLYINALTGETVSYEVTGMAMGAIPMPTYGGMGSQFGQASYGIFSTGATPILEPTPGVYTETSTAGNAFGQGYQYAASQPDQNAILAMNLMQSPSTAGLGYALAYTSGGLGGLVSPGAIGGLGSIGSFGGLGTLGGFGGINSTGGLGIGSNLGGIGGIGGLGIGSSLGGIGSIGGLGLGLNQGLMTGGYGLTPSYGTYTGGYAAAPVSTGGYIGAPSYGGGYAAAPVSTGYVPGYGYQNVQYAPQSQTPPPPTSATQYYY
jgi:hypothetical protein